MLNASAASTPRLRKKAPKTALLARQSLLVLWGLCTIGCLLGAQGCDDRKAPAPPRAELKPERIQVRAADVVAGLEHSITPAPDRTNPTSKEPSGARSAAIGPDDDYASDEPVETAFLVYRAQLRVPVINGFVSRTSHRPTAELHIWSSSERLRAKFVGNAWPVADGSEVRLRADHAGAIVIDERGMRPLGPGQVAHWFAGTPLTHSLRPTAAVAMVSEKEAGGPRHLLCELLAEWTNQPRPAIAPRCALAGPNPRLRIGQWWAARTVSMYQSLPKRRLRMDMPLTEPVATAFSAIQPRPPAGRTVRNHYTKRLLTFSGGQPWGWLGPKQELFDAPCIKQARAAVDAFGGLLRVAALRHDPVSECFEAFSPRPVERPSEAPPAPSVATASTKEPAEHNDAGTSSDAN